MSVERDIGSASSMAEKIHSGQFMISKYDEESDTEDLKVYNKVKGFNFEPSLFKKNFTFSDGTEEMLEIDGSLQKMFQFLSLTMSGKITNPKWNSFKGVKFHSKDKIRLNNIIWREYHMQCECLGRFFSFWCDLGEVIVKWVLWSKLGTISICS